MKSEEMKAAQTVRNNRGCVLVPLGFLFGFLFGLAGLGSVLTIAGSEPLISLGLLLSLGFGLPLSLAVLAIPVIYYLLTRLRAPAEKKPVAEVEKALPRRSLVDYLLGEIEIWRKEDLISARLYENLLQRYRPEIVPAIPAVEVGPTPAATPVPAPAPSAPKAQAVPFTEWLLSPRNIKVALYTGALLLVLAGIAFVGSRWGEFTGPVKFAILLLVTGLLHLGGFLLYQRRGLRLGGIAVLGAASAFLPLNFAVLQIYVLGPSGFRGDVMWLIASAVCMSVYVRTAYWTRASLFTYISIGATVSMLTASLVVAEVPAEAYPLAYLLLAQAMLLLARGLQKTRLAGFTRTPLLVTTQLAAPVLTMAAFFVAVMPMAGFPGLRFYGNPWPAPAGIFVGVLFYVSTDAFFGWAAARWAAAGLLPVAFGLSLAQLHFSATVQGMAQMLLAMAYLGVGYALEQREGRHKAGWPVYAAAYLLALWVTGQAAGNIDDLIRVSLGDVAILSLSAVIHRHYAWVYGAAWLFMLPAYLFLYQRVPALPQQGLLMGALGLVYVAAGYVLSRREVSASTLPHHGGPFLTAATFLSAVVVVLAWGSPIMVTFLLAVVAVLYLGMALWLGWSLLVFPAVAAVNLGVFTTQEIFLGYSVADLRVLDIAYAALALALVLSGLGLRRRGQDRWAIPLYAFGALDLAGSYGAALLDRPLAITLSAIYATLLLMYAWLERSGMRRIGLGAIPLLTYLGLGAMVIGQFHVLDAARLLEDWPPWTAGLCVLFVLLSWRLRTGEPASVYGLPLRWAGLALTLLPMAGALATLRPLIIATTFGIVGLVYGGDALIRRMIYLAYLSGGTFLVVYWALLRYFGVDEPQAYLIPCGLVPLGLGWNQRRQGHNLTHLLLTLLGLTILLGSSFIQSLSRGGYIYAAWLGVESVLAIRWGIWTRSRGYVIVGALALVTNGVAQFGPAFVEMPRWFQLAVTGGILLGSGIALLIRREKLLRAWRAFSEEWTG